MAIMPYNGEEDLNTAAQYIEQESALYRHYRIDEVQLCVEQFTGVSLSDEQAIELVQGLRNQHGMSEIAAWNLPGGYEDDEESSC